jgi:CheY-like chemotaxis protein
MLVVDDDPYTRRAFALLFTRDGWSVALAGSLAEALPFLNPAPDCVILDLDLPDGAGETLLAHLRARCPRTAVAVCSGVSDPERLQAVHRLGPELMLWKPIEMAPVFQLCAQVRAAAS